MKKIIILSFALALNTVVFASNISDKSGTTGFAFLKIAQGAKAMALGDSFCGLADDVNALYWNPAGIANLNTRQATAGHTFWLDSISRSYVAYTFQNEKFGAFGLNVGVLSVPGIEGRIAETDAAYDSLTVNSNSVELGWGKKIFSKTAFGAGVKFAYENLGNTSVSGGALDIGALHEISETASLGLSLQNIGGQDFPMLLRLGASKRMMQDKLMLLGEYYNGLVDQTSSLSVGGEYKANNILYPRLGVKYGLSNVSADAPISVSVGFGLVFNKYQFDYGYKVYEDFGGIHQLDFLVKF